MQHTEPAAKERSDWILCNPWFWMVLGFGLELLAFGLVRTLAEGGGAFRFLLVGAGLLSVGGALTLRLRSTGAASLERMPPEGRSALLVVLIAFHVLLALGVTVALGLSFFSIDAIGWRPGQLVLLWFVVVPLSGAAASVCYGRLAKGGQVTRGEEAAALLTLTALACFVANWALYRPGAPDEAATIRLLFAVMTLVALVSAPLVVVPQAVRRAAVSGLIVLHLAGICTAALAAPPTPWAVGQLWVRIYRPYLEFMYLNNAYHFYAPEPGPASHLWFRVTYLDSKGSKFYHWVKIPDVDEDGNPRHRIPLEYSRILALNENAISTEARYLEPDRLIRRNRAAGTGPDLIGDERPSLVIPYYPFSVVPQAQQCAPPSAQARRLLQAYARHVARKPHPDDNADALQVHRVKIYKLAHAIPWPAFAWIFKRDDIRNLDTYRVHFLGEYDKNGELVDEYEPFLYWMLPVVREKGVIRSYLHLHAADPKWIFLTGERRWVEIEPQLPAPP